MRTLKSKKIKIIGAGLFGCCTAIELSKVGMDVTLVEKEIAKFPDAITERGKRHVEHLGKMAENGLRTMVLFVVQRHDATSFQPQWERDPKFGFALFEAWKKGLNVRVIHMKMTPNKIHYLGELPFKLKPES